jgi:hypothetical protein
MARSAALLALVLGVASACGGAGDGTSARPDPSPWVATASSAAFDVTLFVTDQVDAPFDPTLPPYPPLPSPGTPARFTAFFDVVNRTGSAQSFLVTERPWQRLQAHDAQDQPVWSLPDPTVPDADLVTLAPGEGVRFRRDFPDALPVGSYHVTASVSTPGPAPVPPVSLDFEAR